VFYSFVRTSAAAAAAAAAAGEEGYPAAATERVRIGKVYYVHNI